MKTKLILITGFLISYLLSHGQQIEANNNTPYIEVAGYAEKKIIPDEIYLKIFLKERMEGKEKLTIQKQEENLKKAILELNIPLEMLSMADAKADYIRIKWNKKDVVSVSEYELLLETPQQVTDVFQKLDELKIYTAYIAKVSHSKIDDFKKEVAIESIKSAKLKADYLLNAIGQKTGIPLIITEKTIVNYLDEIRVRGSRVSNEKYEAPNQDKFGEIAFQKINIESTIYVKYEIK